MSSAEFDESLERIRQAYAEARGTDDFRAVVRRTAKDLSELVLKVFESHNGQLYTRLVASVRALKRTCPEVVHAMSLKAKLRFRRVRKTRIAVTADAAVAWPPLRVKALEAVVAKSISCPPDSVSLTLNGYQGFASSAFRGVCADGRRIFVKLGPQASLERSRAVHAACSNLPFIPNVLNAPDTTFETFSVLVTDVVDGIHIDKHEQLNEGQLKGLVDGYVRFSSSIQSVDAALVKENSYYGDVDTDFAVVADFSRRHPLLSRGFADLLRLKPEDRSFAGRAKSVIHGDFTHTNYAFSPDGLAAIYDYDCLARGLPCYELSLGVPGRYMDRHVSPSTRRRLRRLFVEMVSFAPYSADEWRLALNMQRVRWIANAVRRNPSPVKAWAALRRFNRRLLELLGDVASR